MVQYAWSHAVQVGVGTGHGRNFYMLELDLTGQVTWMQCRPSNPALPQASPIFDTSLSPSCAKVRAASPICTAPYTREAPPADKCSFQVLSHGAFAEGHLGTDEFAFASSSGGSAAAVPGVVFGCSDTTRGFLNHGTLAGVLSMSRHPSSFIKQLAGRQDPGQFSYCLAAGGNSRGFLRFGVDITYPDNRRHTAIMSQNHQQQVEYHMRVVGVILDGKKLAGITPDMFQGGNGGCKIDVGSPVSKMVHAAYNVLEREVAAHLLRHGAHRIPNQQRLCVLDTKTIRRHLPILSLQLYEGVNFDIKPELLFLEVINGAARHLCFAVESHEFDTVLGGMQQLTTQFIFDLANNDISFAPARC